jgi:CRP-like cAMP-binding protein
MTDASAFFPYPDSKLTSSSGFLSNLHEDEIKIVVGFGQMRRYLPDEYAVRAGDPGRALFIIMNGRFQVLVPSPRGFDRANDLSAGDIFGELAFFDRLPREADVRAVTNAEALIMTPEGFERFRLREPRLAILFVLDLGRILSTRFRTYNRRLAALGKL